MASKEDLKEWILDSIQGRGGSATVVQVAEDIWKSHEDELRASGRLFYTWQYDMRWAALELRKADRLRPAAESPSGTWELP